MPQRVWVHARDACSPSVPAQQVHDGAAAQAAAVPGLDRQEERLLAGAPQQLGAYVAQVAVERLGRALG